MVCGVLSAWDKDEAVRRGGVVAKSNRDDEVMHTRARTLDPRATHYSTCRPPLCSSKRRASGCLPSCAYDTPSHYHPHTVDGASRGTSPLSLRRWLLCRMLHLRGRHIRGGNVLINRIRRRTLELLGTPPDDPLCLRSVLRLFLVFKCKVNRARRWRGRIWLISSTSASSFVGGGSSAQGPLPPPPRCSSSESMHHSSPHHRQAIRAHPHTRYVASTRGVAPAVCSIFTSAIMSSPPNQRDGRRRRTAGGGGLASSSS